MAPDEEDLLFVLRSPAIRPGDLNQYRIACRVSSVFFTRYLPLMSDNMSVELDTVYKTQEPLRGFAPQFGRPHWHAFTGSRGHCTRGDASR